jgi:hypothetical protein
MGYDLACSKVVPDPIVCEKIKSDVASEDENDDLYPACAVTRLMTRRKDVVEDVERLDPAGSSHDFDLCDTFLIDLDGSSDVNSQLFKREYPLKMSILIPILIYSQTRMKIPSVESSCSLTRI